MNKKVIKIISLILFIISLILIIFGIYLNFDKEVIKEETISKIYLSTTDEEIINIYSNIIFNPNNRCIDITDSLTDLSIESNNISNGYVLDITVLDYMNYQENIPNYIYLDEVKEKINNKFGVKYNFDISKLDKSYYYDKIENNKIYLKESSSCDKEVYTKIHQVSKYKNILEIEEYRLYKQDGVYYQNKYTDTSFEYTKNSDGEIEDTIENYTNGNKYLYTLKLNENNYYLEKIERLFN